MLVEKEGSCLWFLMGSRMIAVRPS
jgi:hypothetical protein